MPEVIRRERERQWGQGKGRRVGGRKRGREKVFRVKKSDKH